VPLTFSQTLWRAQNTLIISKDGYTKISFKEIVFWEKWAQCYSESAH